VWDVDSEWGSRRLEVVVWWAMSRTNVNERGVVARRLS
jgi:hypothetical protein